MASLAQLLLLLSSDQPGEVAAAARAIGKALVRDGKDWHWLAGQLSGQPRPERRRDDDDDEPEAFDHIAAARWLLATHEVRLRDREVEFLSTMVHWRGEPTEKQAKWLAGLCRRFGYRP